MDVKLEGERAVMEEVMDQRMRPLEHQSVLFCCNYLRIKAHRNLRAVCTIRGPDSYSRPPKTPSIPHRHGLLVRALVREMTTIGNTPGGCAKNHLRSQMALYPPELSLDSGPIWVRESCFVSPCCCNHPSFQPNYLRPPRKGVWVVFDDESSVTLCQRGDDDGAMLLVLYGRERFSHAAGGPQKTLLRRCRRARRRFSVGAGGPQKRHVEVSGPCPKITNFGDFKVQRSPLSRPPQYTSRKCRKMPKRWTVLKICSFFAPRPIAPRKKQKRLIGRSRCDRLHQENATIDMKWCFAPIFVPLRMAQFQADKYNRLMEYARAHRAHFLPRF